MHVYKLIINLNLSIRFPGLRVRGCLFHFSQRLFKRIIKLGLQDILIA